MPSASDSVKGTKISVRYSFFSTFDSALSLLEKIPTYLSDAVKKFVVT